MKYLDYIKRQIYLLSNKTNIIRFHIERRLSNEDKFLDDLANNTPNSEQFETKKKNGKPTIWPIF